MNDHGGAATVHADQDVYGTPLTQLMDGRAPELFVHDSPGAQPRCSDAAGEPVDPVAAGHPAPGARRRPQPGPSPSPAALRPAHRIVPRRTEDQVINDIWHLLHDDAQQWYFHSDMDHRNALVFNTLSTPHGAGVLPGEDVAECCYLALEAAESAAASGDVDGLNGTISIAGDTNLTVPTRTTPALDTIAAMVAVLDQAAADPAGVCANSAEEWTAASQLAHQHVVRMSLEDAHGGLGRRLSPDRHQRPPTSRRWSVRLGAPRTASRCSGPLG